MRGNDDTTGHERHVRGTEFKSLEWLDANRRFATAIVQSLTSPASALSPRISGVAAPIRPLMDGCPERGRRIYHGEFCFAGHSVLCRGSSIFEVKSPGRKWLEHLYGFSWLGDLEATDLELARVNARALVSDWLERDRCHPKLARNLAVLSRRLISWISAAPYLLRHAGEDFLLRFCSGLANHVRDLQLRSPFCLSSALVLDCTTALAYAAIGLKGMEGTRDAVLEQLAVRMDQQILPDGGHVSRNPAEIARLLLDILPLRRSCQEARIAMPAKLEAAIERMLPMLQFFLHGDGGLAMFHGADSPLTAQCGAILAADVTQGKPLSSAPYCGFIRLSHGGSLVICDTGSSGKGPTPAPLAIEFSEGSSRIVINCRGLFDQERSSQVEPDLLRAHSTAELLAPSHQAPLPIRSLLANWRQSPVAEANLSSTPLGSLIEARHGVYAQLAGLIHERCLFLSAAGDDFRGEDRYVPLSGNVKEAIFCIRFHLHPDVRAELSEDATYILLKLHSGSAWTFKVRGAEMSLADNICSQGKSNSRKTKHIILTGSVNPSPVHWAFKRARF
jgi:uncharacterized heparinase superfamily protein